MKRFSASCVCGSRIEFTDDAESMINPMHGELDSKGRRFLIEVRADEWLALHNKCLEARITRLNHKQKNGKAKRTV